jgi:hypothetical protein
MSPLRRHPPECPLRCAGSPAARRGFASLLRSDGRHPGARQMRHLVEVFPKRWPTRVGFGRARGARGMSPSRRVTYWRTCETITRRGGLGSSSPGTSAPTSEAAGSGYAGSLVPGLSELEFRSAMARSVGRFRSPVVASLDWPNIGAGEAASRKLGDSPDPELERRRASSDRPR